MKNSPLFLGAMTAVTYALSPSILAKPVTMDAPPAIIAPAPVNASLPDELIRTLSGQLLSEIKNNPVYAKGDKAALGKLVDAQIMPHVNFSRMTASVVGKSWNSATPAQKAKIQAEFKSLLVRTYATALGQMKDKTVDVKRLRASPAQNEVVVKTELKGKGGAPVTIDYRMEKTAGGWKVYDVNVLGIWLVESYRADFAQTLNASGGIDGLIAQLAARNAAKPANASK